MQTRKNEFLSRRVVYLSTDKIRPNPAQPRRYFDEKALAELAQSIREYGILQPLTVRMGAHGYELVAGERRLRAARLAGMSEVPCIVARAGEEESSALALIENLQRRDLHFMEEAAAIARLITSCRMSQEEAAQRLGKSQSAIANKLRLLRLPPDCVVLLREAELTERHARVLLRLSSDEEKLSALRHIIDHKLNVAQSEEYIEKLLSDKAVTPPRKAPTYIIKDVRLFLNSVQRSVHTIRSAGVDAALEREDTPDEIRVTIRIPRRN